MKLYVLEARTITRLVPVGVFDSYEGAELAMKDLHYDRFRIVEVELNISYFNGFVQCDYWDFPARDKFPF